MNEFVFDRGFSPWEMALSKLNDGDVLTSGRFLALMEQDETVDPEMAAMDLEQRGVMLNVSDLPKFSGSGRTGERLSLEAKCYREGTLLENLEENDPLRLTLLQIRTVAPLENEQDYAQKAAAGDESAMELVTRGYLPAVYELAGEYLQRGVLLVDLLQEGSLGLWQAVLNYRCGSFREQAHRWIRQAMARAVTLQAHAGGIGVHMAGAMERYREADRDLLTRLGRNPTEEEIAQQMGVTYEEAAAVGKMLREAESMERVKQANGPKQPDPEDEQAVEDTAYFQSRQRISEMLSGLSEGDALIVSLRFGLDGKPPMTVQQVAGKLGLSEAEVTDREAAALKALRQDG